MDSFSLRELFLPVSGLIVAVVATVGAVLTAILGPSKKLRLPIESVPGTSRGLLNVVLFAPFLICFFLMEPAWARPALLGALVPVVAAVWCYQNYGGMLNIHRYIKPRARHFLWFQWIREEPLIGGTELKPEAATRKALTGRTEQEILADAEYNPDEIWERDSRALVQKKIERWYYGFMLWALLTIVLAALAAQTLLSGEAPLTAAQRVWTKLIATGHVHSHSSAKMTTAAKQQNWVQLRTFDSRSVVDNSTRHGSDHAKSQQFQQISATGLCFLALAPRFPWQIGRRKLHCVLAAHTFHLPARLRGTWL